jgi:hypothetical protein
MLHCCYTSIKVPLSPCFGIADERGGVRLVLPEGAVALSPEEGRRLLFDGSMVEKGRAVLRLVGRLVHVTIDGSRYSISAPELGQLFRDRRGRCLLVKVAPRPGAGI